MSIMRKQTTMRFLRFVFEGMTASKVKDWVVTVKTETIKSFKFKSLTLCYCCYCQSVLIVHRKAYSWKNKPDHFIDSHNKKENHFNRA